VSDAFCSCAMIQAEMPGRFIAGLLDPYRIPRAG
jgi:hypothetical protein